MKALILVLTLISVQAFATENQVYKLSKNSVGEGLTNGKIWFNEEELQLTLNFDQIGSKVISAKVTDSDKTGYCGNTYKATYLFNRSISWEIEVTDYNAGNVLCEIMIINDVVVRITEYNNHRVTQGTTLAFDKAKSVQQQMQ